MTRLGCWQFDLGRRKPTVKSLKRKGIFSKVCPIFKYEIFLTQIWQIGWNFCPETNQSVDWWWYETKLRYWESKSWIKFQNHIVPISLPISAFEDLKFPGPKFYSFDWFFHLQPISNSTIDGIRHDWGAGRLIWVGGRRKPTAENLTNEKVYFQKVCPVFQIYFLNTNLTDWVKFLPRNQ